jgi:pilus assembly protein CpaE
MYPLSVILVNCSADTLSQLRRELEGQRVHVEAECADTAALIQYEREAANRTNRMVPEWTGSSASGGTEQRRLYVIELKLARDLLELRWIANTFVGQPILVIMPGGREDLTVIHAMREGAAQVVLLPLQSEDFEAALNRIGQQFAPPASNTNVIAVCGINGGCGATTVAINLAYEMAHLYQVRCILAELSPQVGAFATYLNVEPQFTTRELFRDIERQGVYAVQKALTRVGDNLEILAGPHRVMAPLEVNPQGVLQLIECIRRLAGAVVLDVPCTFDPLFFHTVESADQLVLVAEQKVLSLRTLKLLREALSRSAAPRPQHLLINRYDPKIQGFTAPELEKILGVPKLLTVRNDWAAVSDALNHGRPLRLEAPQSRALADLDALAAALRGADDSPRPQKASGLYRQLRRAIGLQ